MTSPTPNPTPSTPTPDPLDIHWSRRDINGNPLPSTSIVKPIAYLYGSFWYDPTCAARLFSPDRVSDLSPCYPGETIAVYQYVCDHCGALIQPRQPQPNDTVVTLAIPDTVVTLAIPSPSTQPNDTTATSKGVEQ